MTQEGLGRVIPGGEGPEDGINVWRQEVFFCHSVLHSWIRVGSEVEEVNCRYHVINIIFNLPQIF